MAPSTRGERTTKKMQIRIPIKPEPHRVSDPDCENYGGLLWKKLQDKLGGGYWSDRPNKCPLGEVGTRVEITSSRPESSVVWKSSYLIERIEIEGGSQIAPAPHRKWEWVVYLKEVRH